MERQPERPSWGNHLAYLMVQRELGRRTGYVELEQADGQLVILPWTDETEAAFASLAESYRRNMRGSQPTAAVSPAR